MSQQELADEADIAKMTIQRIENGRVRVTIDTMFALAPDLKITLKELMDFKVPEEEEHLLLIQGRD